MMRYLIVIFCYFIFISCKKNECKINDTSDIDAWSPYKEGQIILFKDSLNNIATIDSITYQNEKSITRPNIGSSREIERFRRTIFFKFKKGSLLKDKSADGSFIEIEKFCDGIVNYQHIYLTFTRNKKSIYYSNDSIFNKYNNYRQKYDTIINNYQYKNVLNVNFSNTNNNDYVLFNKENGIIQFRDNNGVLWTLDK